MSQSSRKPVVVRRKVNKLVEHPAYDSFWQLQAMDKLLAQEPLAVPTMLVHGLWEHAVAQPVLDRMEVEVSAHRGRACRSPT